MPLTDMFDLTTPPGQAFIEGILGWCLIACADYLYITIKDIKEDLRDNTRRTERARQIIRTNPATLIDRNYKSDFNPEGYIGPRRIMSSAEFEQRRNEAYKPLP